MSMGVRGMGLITDRPGRYVPRMAPKRAKPIMRLVPDQYRQDYCRLAGMGYPMVVSHVRMLERRGARLAWYAGWDDLIQRMNRTTVDHLWYRCWWRSRLPSQPK